MYSRILPTAAPWWRTFLHSNSPVRTLKSWRVRSGALQPKHPTIGSDDSS
jgi:hypothetical protein